MGLRFPSFSVPFTKSLDKFRLRGRRPPSLTVPFRAFNPGDSPSSLLLFLEFCPFTLKQLSLRSVSRGTTLKREKPLVWGTTLWNALDRIPERRKIVIQNPLCTRAIDSFDDASEFVNKIC